MLGFLAAFWIVLAGAEFLLMTTVSGTAVREPRLPVTARLALLATEPMVLAPAILVLIGPVAMWLARWRLRRRLGRIRHALVLLPAVLVTGAALFFVAASWGAFHTTGRFLDPDALRLWAANPVQLVQHVIQTEGLRLAWVSVAVCLSSLFICTALVRLLVEGGRPLVRRLTRIATLGIAACSVGVIGGQILFSSDRQPVDDPRTGATSPVSEVYTAARADRSGPVAHVVSAVKRRAWIARAVANTSDVRIVRRDQISMDQYLAAADTVDEERWNVIVMLLESLRPDQLVSFGGSREVMPALDSLAQSSTVFTKAYCQANNSFAGDPCALSGQYPVRERGMHIYPADPPYPRVMIYDLLQALGFRTAIVSSQNEGWGRMIDFLDTGTLDMIFHAETAPDSGYVEPSDSAFAAWIGATQMAGKLDDRVTIDAAIRWIDEQPKRPFFLYLNLQSSHLPYRVPDDFVRPYGPDTIDFRLAFGSYPRDKNDIVKDLYADSLRYMDTQISRLFAHLKAEGLMERTIIIATGDSGEAFYEHGFSAHANKIYNEVMRVPLIVHAPGLAADISIAPAQHVDIPPTVLELLGLPPHPSFQGVGLFKPPPSPDRSLYLSVQLPGAQQFGIVRGDLKLIFDVLEQRSYLYDLARDPGEVDDLSSKMPTLAHTLQSRLHTWYEAQASYFEDHGRMQVEYPPVLVD